MYWMCRHKMSMFMFKLFVEKVDKKCDGHKFKHGKLGLSTVQRTVLRPLVLRRIAGENP